MMQLQIKAKSGLHAGAVWNLTKAFVTLGASSRADVFLCDPEIPDSLITLSRYGRRYVIEGMDPGAKLLSADNSKVENTLFPSQTVTLDYRHIQLDMTLITVSHSIASRMGESSFHMMHTFLRFLQGLGARAIVAFLFIVCLLMTSLILFFGTAGVAKTQASVLGKKGLQAERAAEVPIGVTMAINVLRDLELFAQQLDTKGISAERQENRIQINAELSRVQGIALERQLSAYARDYGNFVELNAALKFTDEQLKVDAIDVEQIVLGRAPAVVLRDGAMLFEGGSYNGLTISSIDSNKVVFQGVATYEVPL